MPILTLGSNGDLIESGGEVDRNRGADYVEEDNILKMSLNESPQTVASRQAILNRKADRLIRKTKKQIENILKLARMKTAEAVQHEKIRRMKDKMSRDLKARRENLIIEGIRQGNRVPEKMSGLSGYGQTSDGSQPYLTFPSVDWKPIENVSVAFGNLLYGDEELGASATPYFSQNKEALVSTMPVATGGIVLPPSKVGAYSTQDQFLIDMFKNGNYAVTTENASNAASKYNHIFDSNMKNKIQNYNEQYNSDTYVVERIQAGWMYSGFFDDDGSWVSLKVPYLYGIPMDQPDNPNTSQRDQWRNRGVYNWDTFKYFNSLKDVIAALARQHIFSQHASKLNQSQLKHEKLNLLSNNSAITYAQELQTTKASKYIHPMLKQGLLKKKA